MSLSVNCMTRGPAPRVAALLGLLREVADEILVAVDDRAEPEVADQLAAVADRVVLYPYEDPVDRPLPWLHAQCTGDWVLTIDDDEVPSAGLIERLPELLRDERVTHYWLRRLWLYPDAGHYLDAHPWASDYLLRLVRNDPRLLRFPPEVHHPIDVLGPCKYVSSPLYHLDCITNSRASREQKVSRYDRLGPRKPIGGLSINEAFYLPELRSSPTSAQVPDHDAELIDAVLTAAPAEVVSRTSERVTREEIDSLWEGRALKEPDYRARIELAEQVELLAGDARTIDVLVENLGGVVWSWGEASPEIRLVARWPGLEGAQELRTQLPADLRPGETQLVPVHVAAPEREGRYVLEIDLVHEHVRWFGCGVTVDANVLPPLAEATGRTLAPSAHAR
ncbi:MAG TPA: hypothetical protein VNC60_06570 [Actinomycetota bacterium]|nr:hypothetical protein [Actinomycetota bacterium]